MPTLSDDDIAAIGAKAITSGGHDPRDFDTLEDFARILLGAVLKHVGELTDISDVPRELRAFNEADVKAADVFLSTLIGNFASKINSEDAERDDTEADKAAQIETIRTAVFESERGCVSTMRITGDESTEGTRRQHSAEFGNANVGGFQRTA